jgi:hypothetical protein
VRLKSVLTAFGLAQGVMAALFAVAGLLLTFVAARTAWDATVAGLDLESAQQIIEAIGLLAAAVVALQIAQTIAEEEVMREMHVSAPTRVRRFLSRFLVVLVVALVIEGLVATFKALHDDLAQLPYAAALILAAAGLLAAWGFFVRANRAAEELEPQQMEEAKREDEKLQ